MLLGLFALLIWGRWRYDLVALITLIVTLLAGAVPAEEAFSSFGHPATATVATVLIVSRGLSNSGGIDLIAPRQPCVAQRFAAHRHNGGRSRML